MILDITSNELKLLLHMYEIWLDSPPDGKGDGCQIGRKLKELKQAEREQAAFDAAMPLESLERGEL